MERNDTSSQADFVVYEVQLKISEFNNVRSPPVTATYFWRTRNMVSSLVVLGYWSAAGMDVALYTFISYSRNSSVHTYISSIHYAVLYL